MRNRRLILSLAAASAALFSIVSTTQAGFTPGDLAVFSASAGTPTTNVTGSIVDLNPSTPNQLSPTVFAIPDSASVTNGLRFSASASSTGYLSHSSDGAYLVFTGVNTTNTTANTNTLNPRGVGTLDATGSYTLQTTYSGTSGNQPRSATSFDDSTWYISDQTGFYTNGTSTASPTGNFRSVKPFGGTAYVLQASSVSGNDVVSTISAPTGGTVAGLPGLTTDKNAQDFYMVSSGMNGSEFDILYVLDDTTATAGTIDKYSLVGGSWTANGTYTTTFGGFGLAAALDSVSGEDLYATTGTGATTNNSVDQLLDTAGYNQTIDITAAPVTLFTATGGATLKGIDFAPTPEPASLSLLAIGGVALLARRRSGK